MTPDYLDVVAMILFDEESVLVAQRTQTDRLAGLWEFPGGKIEVGETPEAALIREIEEELSLQIAVLEHFNTTVYNVPPVPIRLYAYTCRIISGCPQAITHSAIRWVKVKDLCHLDLAPADIPLAEALAKTR